MKFPYEFESELREQRCWVSYLKSDIDDAPDWEVTIKDFVIADLNKVEQSRIWKECEEHWAEYWRGYHDYMTMDAPYDEWRDNES